MFRRQSFSRLLASGLMSVFLLAFSVVVRAEGYPDRPIYLVVSYAAGSSDDVVARQLVPKLSTALGQKIIIENKPGAGGTLGSALVAHEKPDGYTLVIGNAADHGLAPSVYKALPYDPVKDFTPVGRMDTEAYALAVSSKLPVKSVKDLIEYARNHPGTLNFASTGVGTGVYLAGVRFGQQAGIDIRHVPYNSIGALATDLHSGAISLMFYPYEPLKPMERSGDIRIIATTGEKRASYLPDVPTMIEAGLPGFVALTWHGLYGPKGMAPETVNTLYTALQKTLSDPSMRAALLSLAVDADVLPPDQFGTFTQDQVDRFRAQAKAAHVKPQ
jgi:tripartite-type tricarboxylate transporter receptor subunit TctC